MLNEAGLKAAVEAVRRAMNLPDWEHPNELIIKAAITAYLASVQGEPVAVSEAAREAVFDFKSKLRLAFRLALSTLPEIAPPEIQSVLSGVYMQDEFFEEGKRLQMKHGIEAVAPRVEQECGAGAWSFMRSGVLAATHPADRDGVEAGGWRVITDDDRPPNDTDVFMGCWQRWPDDKWLVEYGLYGSTKGGWIHGRMTHWLPSSILPTPPASTKGGE